jgi:exosortase/archaeosortase family protein
VLLELVVAAAVCFAGYWLGARWMQEHEARWVVGSLRLFGFDDVSDALPGHILIFGSDGAALNAEVTASCSSILSIVGLTALTIAVFRERRQHALFGLLVSTAALVALNWVRLTASTLAGIWWGRPAMILFHDWVGSLWNFTATFLGFLVLVAVTLPAPERAEQDASGRHTARRPSSWARPGLGYDTEHEAPSRRRGRGITGLYYRYLLPRGVSVYLGRRREAGRIDYRIGHLSPGERIARVRELAADGLGAHTASLLAVATYDREVEVLDTLAAEVAVRQWEPVTSPRLTSLRLWARGWMMARGIPPPGAAMEHAPQVVPTGSERTPTDEDHATRPIAELPAELRRFVPVPPSRSRTALPMTSAHRRKVRRTFAARPVRQNPRSFAAPRPPHHDATAEDSR